MKDVIKMKFTCNQDLSDMSCTEKGLFCSLCQKEVIDFTEMSVEDAKRYKAANGETCGIFTPEHIDPDFIKPVDFQKPLRYVLLYSGILAAASSGATFAQSTVDPKKEQSQGTSNAPNFTVQEQEEKLKNGEHISMSLGNTPSENAAGPQPERDTSKRHKKSKMKKYYWSRRFPFVHRYRRRIVGKF